MIGALLKLLIKIVTYVLDFIVTSILSLLNLTGTTTLLDNAVSSVGTFFNIVSHWLVIPRGMLDLTTIECKILFEILAVKITYPLIIYLLKSVIKFFVKSK